MKKFEWNDKKNDWLKKHRHISFEEIEFSLKERGLIDNIRNPNRKKYPKKNIYIIEINKYAYIVPYVEDEDKIFFKTIIPSRKMTKIYKLKSI